MPPQPAFASRAPPTCRASTRSPRSIAPPATTSSDCCCRRARFPPCPARSSAPTISAPPGAAPSAVLVSWEPFDFGLRRANVAAASALEPNPKPALKRTEFEVAVATADAYLTLAAAQETVRAAQAGVDRADVLLRTITALVNAQLRPGADASRAEAELAAARTQLIQAQQAVDVARATSRAVRRHRARPDRPRRLAGLLQLPPEQTLAAARHRQRIPSRSSRTPPSKQTLGADSALWNAPISRASICRAPPTPAAPAPRPTADILGGLNGLAPNVQNYALGFTVTFPIVDLPAIHAREAAQSATIRAQTGAVRSRSPPTCAPSGIAPSRTLERRTRRRRQHARPGLGRAHRHPAGDRSLRGRPRQHRSKSPKRSACSPRPKSTTRWPASASGAACSASPPPPATFNPSWPRPAR